MPTRPEALRLADLLESCPLAVGDAQQAVAAAELRRLHAERAAADGVINDLVAKVRELQKENESLAAALASSCDEQRHELWESGGIAGCERARVAERQRDALQEANEAFGKRQEWWNEKMLTLEAQCDVLLKALSAARCAAEGAAAQRDALLEALKYLDKEFRQHGRQHWPEAVRVRLAIKLVEEGK